MNCPNDVVAAAVCEASGICFDINTVVPFPVGQSTTEQRELR